uniref:Retrotransposon gag domain-containing protein n=1 Tax=Trichogramma kaykai TaxID=54128 RepID=A0ABD2WFR3_9HYME
MTTRSKKKLTKTGDKDALLNFPKVPVIETHLDISDTASLESPHGRYVTLEELDRRLARFEQRNENRIREMTPRQEQVTEAAEQRIQQRINQLIAQMNRIVSENIDQSQNADRQTYENTPNDRVNSTYTERTNQNPPCTHTTQRQGFLQPAKIIIPTFSAAPYEKPMIFLNDFMDYAHAVGLTELHFKHIVKQALKGPSADWWDHISHTVHTFAQFQHQFKQRYWNRLIQARKRESLEFGHYTAEKNMSRSEYVISIHNQVKMLDDAPSEIDLIDKFSRHFDDATQNAIVTQRLHRIDDLIEFLDRLDNMGKLNAERETVRPKREPYWQRDYTQNHSYTKFQSPNRYNSNNYNSNTYNTNNSRHTKKYNNPSRPTTIHEIDINTSETLEDDQIRHNEISHVSGN